MSQYADFMAHVRAAVGRDIYLWGGGQPQLWTLAQLTDARIEQKETSTANANRVKKLWNARKGIYPGAYAADCSGGIIYCMMLAGIVPASFDDTANGLLNRCVQLSGRGQLRAGDWVGQRSGTNTFHIGVVDRVDGSGQIWINEWRGRDSGAVCTRIEDGASTWNRYGRPDWAYVADGQEETPGETTPNPVPAPDWELTRLLKLASPYMRGNDVHNAQLALIARGHTCGSTGADGIYGSGTRAAVTAFQKAAGLHADGVIGRSTCEALGGKVNWLEETREGPLGDKVNWLEETREGPLGDRWQPDAATFTLKRLLKLTSPLMTGDDVKAVQQALLRRDYSVGAMRDDGAYGSRTKAAVKSFQKAVGLNADGIVGQKTCQALNGKWEG